MLYQLLKSLSSALVQTPRGQASPWGTGAGLDQGFGIRMLGERLSDRTRRFADVVSLFLALHVMALQYILDLAPVMVYEYSRNHYMGQQARELAQERRVGNEAALKTITPILEHGAGATPAFS